MYRVAQKVHVVISDDLDGSADAETIAFGWDGVNYEIDLSAKNRTKLDKAFAPYVQAARRVSRSPWPSRSQAKPELAAAADDPLGGGEQPQFPPPGGEGQVLLAVHWRAGRLFTASDELGEAGGVPCGAVGFDGPVADRAYHLTRDHEQDRSLLTTKRLRYLQSWNAVTRLVLVGLACPGCRAGR
jgi:hypothetical protein